MAKDDFIDLLNFSEEDKTYEDDETLDSVLKEGQMSDTEFKEQIGEKKVLENDDFTLKLYQKDGTIDTIEIECKCGRKTSVKLDYDSPEPTDQTDEPEIKKGTASYGEMSLPQSAEAESEESEMEESIDEDTDEADAVFEEGIAAEVVEEKPKHDAVPEQGEDDEAPT